jgi:hypothetical protein
MFQFCTVLLVGRRALIAASECAGHGVNSAGFSPAANTEDVTMRAGAARVCAAA